MADGVLKWAWQYHALTVDTFPDLDDALAAAYYAAENGDESLACIEIPGEGRVLSPDEVADLNRWRDEAAMASWRARPPLVARVRLTAPDGRVSTYSSYESTAKAEEDAARFVALLGPGRVSVEPLHTVSR